MQFSFTYGITDYKHDIVQMDNSGKVSILFHSIRFAFKYSGSTCTFLYSTLFITVVKTTGSAHSFLVIFICLHLLMVVTLNPCVG